MVSLNNALPFFAQQRESLIYSVFTQAGSLADTARAWLSTGVRQSTQDVTVTQGNLSLIDVAVTDTRLYALYFGGTTSFNVYNRATGAFIERIIPNPTIDVTEIGDAIAVTPTRIYILSASVRRIYSITHAGVHQTSEYRNLGGVTRDWVGLHIENGITYVMNVTDNKIYAYNAAGTMQASLEISIPDVEYLSFEMSESRIYAREDTASNPNMPSSAIRVMDRSGNRIAAEDIDLGAGQWNGVAVG